MNDDHSKSVEKQPQNSVVQNTQLKTNPVENNQVKKVEPQVQSAAANNANTQNNVQTNVQTTTSSSAARPATRIQSIPEPQIKKVDIVIAGVTYPIYCPVHEQEELLSAVSHINDNALSLRRDSPSLSQESILVLCCLNLYDKIHNNERSEQDRLQQTKQTDSLLNKIMKDAHSIL